MRLLVVCAIALAGCGRIGFDPAIDAHVDTWTYSAPQPIYLYNDLDPAKTIAIAPNQPLGLAGASAFSITPDLAAATGLDFDPSTGVISGLPSRTSPTTEYVVRATSPSQTMTATVRIRTAPGFYVTSTSDAQDALPGDNDCIAVGGGCTLRSALDELSGHDSTPRVALVVPGTILLTAGELGANNNIEIIGAGQGATVVDAQHASRALNFGIDHTGILSDLTIQNGTDTVGGCVFLMGGAFRLERVTFDSCTATTGDAGGVYIWDNYGNNPITATISQCTFSRSTTAGRGGGIAIAGAQNAVTGCTFLQNSATTTGAALYHIGGHLTISDSLFAANSGGYTFYFEGASVAELTNDTIVDNTEGGVSTNNAAQVTLVNDTIANNQCNVQSCYNGVGIRQNSGGTLTLTNTILFHNIQNGMDGNCSANGSVTSLGHNLTDSAANARIGPIASDLILTDPLLGPLADNGGPTQTVAITIDSPAYNAADDAVCPPTDERDVPRPAAGRCDIGAFEVQ